MEVTKTMMIDIADLSRSLDVGIGEYLRPEEAGWYLPYELEPTLKEGRPYFTQVDGRLVKMRMDWKPVKIDVFDQHADIIVPANLTGALKETSYPHPSRVIKLIKACANHLLDVHAAWGGIYEDQHRRETQEHGGENPGYSTIRKQVEEVLDEYGLLELAKIDEQRMHPSQVHFLKERARHLRKLPSKEVRRDVERSPVNLNAIIAEFVYPQYEGQDDILSMIEDHLLDFRTTLLDFLGKDKWIMHFLKISRGSLIVEKTVDYRIYSWMVEHGYWDRSH